MNKLKIFLQTKEAKRALWTVLNSVMALVIAGLAYLAADSVAWAVAILPIAQAGAQFITKTINT